MHNNPRPKSHLNNKQFSLGKQNTFILLSLPSILKNHLSKKIGSLSAVKRDRWKEISNDLISNCLIRPPVLYLCVLSLVVKIRCISIDLHGDQVAQKR